MLISEVIQRVKDYSGGIDSFTGKPIDEETTRDKVLYGDTAQECTGIVTCIWPTVDIIKRARELGANCIISHEAIFWNHGDHQDTVGDTAAFKAKKELLDDWGGAVWRCHDFIHSRVPIDTDRAMADGIFYGLADKLGWLDYRVGDDRGFCLEYEIPETDATELARELVAKLDLNGTRITGDSHARVRRVRIPMHVTGEAKSDTHEINETDARGDDCLMPWSSLISLRASTSVTPACLDKTNAPSPSATSILRNRAWSTWCTGCPRRWGPMRFRRHLYVWRIRTVTSLPNG